MPEQFSAVDVIAAKRDGHRLTDAQIDWVIDAYVRGVVADEQMASLAMAIFFAGLDHAELLHWTDAMVRSGERLDLRAIGRPTVDKHSTGGVGDKVSLPLVPIVAACGAAVPQLSGRGLGHTGGTLDKMESIPGWRATLTTGEMADILRAVGCVICAAGDGLAPADRKLYALRDVTATVNSIPLIASSIMSKKIAEGTESLLLDVKTGSGAFMTDLSQARLLAETMVDIGKSVGLNTRALVTAMDVPLGSAIGNALEVSESVEILSGGGPEDLVSLTLEMAREMLDLAGITDVDPEDAVRSGRAMDSWRKMVMAQGGDPDAPLPQARYTHTQTSTVRGVVTRVDARLFGTAAWNLGAGRARKEERVSAGAGITLNVKPGEFVSPGLPLFTAHSDDENRIPIALEMAMSGLLIEENATSGDVVRLPLIIDRVT